MFPDELGKVRTLLELNSAERDEMQQEIAAVRASNKLKDIALADMRVELDDTRRERDRYIERCRVLQDRLDQIRQVVQG